MDRDEILRRLSFLNFEQTQALYWFCQFDQSRSKDAEIGEQIPKPDRPGETISGSTARLLYREALAAMLPHDPSDICVVMAEVFGYPPDWTNYPIQVDTSIDTNDKPVDTPVGRPVTPIDTTGQSIEPPEERRPVPWVQIGMAIAALLGILLCILTVFFGANILTGDFPFLPGDEEPSPVVVAGETPTDEPTTTVEQTVVEQTEEPAATPETEVEPISTPEDTPIPPTPEQPTETPLPPDTPTITPTPTDTATPTLTPSPVPVVEFADNFSDGLDPAWQGASADDFIFFPQGMRAVNEVFITIGHETWTNYTVELDIVEAAMRIVRGNFIAVRLSGGNMVAVGFADAGDQGSWQSINGDWERIPDSIHRNPTTGQILRVIADGNLITAFIGPNQTLSHLTTFTIGKVGLKLSPGTTVSEIRIQPLP